MTENGEKEKESNVVDIYRQTPIRFLGEEQIVCLLAHLYVTLCSLISSFALLFLSGYANEVGESFRSLISVHLVNFSYAVAFGYCLADTIDKTIARKKVCECTLYCQ
jgi:hypothetical protein